MSVAPLFVPDIDTLKTRLRLSGVQADTDVQTILEGAIRETRLRLIGELTNARLTVYGATSLAENPSTQAEIDRYRVEILEELMIRRILIQRLPQLFMDSSSEVRQTWNEEGLTRNISQREIQRLLDAIETEIQAHLTALRGEQASGINVTVIGPTEPQPLPGSSIASESEGMYVYTG